MQPLHVQWASVDPHHPPGEQQVNPFWWFGSHWDGELSFSGYNGPQRPSSRHRVSVCLFVSVKTNSWWLCCSIITRYVEIKQSAMTIVNLQKVHDFVYEEYPIFDIFLFGMVMFVDQLFCQVVKSFFYLFYLNFCCNTV